MPYPFWAQGPVFPLLDQFLRGVGEMSAGLLPSSAILDGWATMDDALSWAGIDPGLARSFFRQLGDPALDSMPVLAMIPSDVAQTALLLLHVGHDG